MRTLGWIALVAVGYLPTPLRAADQGANVRRILDRAIAVRGGEAFLTAHPAATWKEHGTYYRNGRAVSYHGDFARAGADNYRMTVEGISSEGKFTIAATASEVWVESNGKVTIVDEGQFANTREELYSAWVESLVPLKDRAFRLTAIGEAQVDGRPAAGIRVSHEGKRAIELFFDRHTGLLAMKRERIKPPGQADEIEQQTIIKEYQQVDGRNRPKKVVLLRDGRPFVEAEISDMQVFEKLDDAIFAKP